MELTTIVTCVHCNWYGEIKKLLTCFEEPEFTKEHPFRIFITFKYPNCYNEKFI